MFTGIIEALGKVEKIDREGTNYHFTIASPISNELKIDQSIAHNGVCLTVVKGDALKHTVTAIEETIIRTNLGQLKEGDIINLERAMAANSRLDGHMVQGHVDDTAECINIQEVEGSWYFTFRYSPNDACLLVDKGSVCINGVSLTVIKPGNDTFQVAIIPYTHAHTNFKNFKLGDKVNIEYDIIGKYLSRYLAVYKKQLTL